MPAAAAATAPQTTATSMTSMAGSELPAMPCMLRQLPCHACLNGLSWRKAAPAFGCQPPTNTPSTPSHAVLCMVPGFRCCAWSRGFGAVHGPGVSVLCMVPGLFPVHTLSYTTAHSRLPPTRMHTDASPRHSCHCSFHDNSNHVFDGGLKSDGSYLDSHGTEVSGERPRQGGRQRLHVLAAACALAALWDTPRAGSSQGPPLTLPPPPLTWQASLARRPMDRVLWA
jgi:hypothetical protein